MRLNRGNVEQRSLERGLRLDDAVPRGVTCVTHDGAMRYDDRRGASLAGEARGSRSLSRKGTQKMSR